MILRDVLVVLVPTAIVTSLVTIVIVQTGMEPLAPCPVCLACPVIERPPARDFGAEVRNRGTKLGDEEKF